MKKLLLFLYSFVKWIIIIVIFILLLVVSILENPSTPLYFVKQPLKDMGISYSHIRGGLLSGFQIKGINYQNRVIAKEISLKVDLEKLRDRELYIDNIVLDGVHIKKEYLNSLIDTNSSKKEDNSSKIELPFDKVFIKNADINLKDIKYNKYQIVTADIHIRNFKTDMKKSYKGVIKLNLNSNIAKADLDTKLNNKYINIISNIEPNRDFIQPYLIDNNISLLSNPKFLLKANGDLKKINYYLDTKRLELKQNQYKVNTKKLIFSGDYNIQKRDINSKLDTQLGGNIGYIGLIADAKLNLDDLNNSLKFNSKWDIEPNRDLIMPYLKESNISLVSNPKILLKASGDFNKIDYYLDTKRVKLTQNNYKIESKKLIVSGDYSIIKKDVNSKLDTNLDGNMGSLNLDTNIKLNLNDINNSLKFDTKADIRVNKTFVSSFVKDKNISISKLEPIDIKASGGLKIAKFDINFRGLKLQADKNSLIIPSLLLKGNSKLLKGDTKVDIKSKLFSNITDSDINSSVKFNFKDINRTLNHNSRIYAVVKSKYINSFLKEEKIKVIKNPKININIEGGIDKIKLKIKAKTEMKKDKYISKLTLNSKPILLNLSKHNIKGDLKILNLSKNMGFDLVSSFDGDYTNPKEITTNTILRIKSFNDFGINLNPLVPIDLKLKNSKQDGVWFNIASKRVQVDAKSRDYDNIKFKIKSRNLYLYKIVELPQELHHKFIKLDIKGSTTISKKFADIKGFIYSNKKFKAKLDIHNNKQGLDSKISTQHLKIIAKGDIDKKEIKAKIEIDSLKALQQELSKLYGFNKFDIDGPLKLDAKLNGEKVWANLNSKKIKLNGFSIEKLDIDANYNNQLITLNKFNFKTTGFKNKKLNRSIYLNKKGKIYLSEKKKIDIDMHPNIRIVADGDSNKLNGKIDIKKLPLGHPDYGSMFLSCNIDYKQRGEDKTIVGNILMKKLKVFYEAKFLDADYDPDVIVITKRDKRKKQKISNDSFLNHTKIDISIKAPEAKYKTPNINLTFDIDMKAYKSFGKDLALLGKIKEINGHFDQIPKRFEIENSNIVFKGGKKINPLLDIKVKYTLPQVVIYIDIGGDANRPKLEFSSEPPMPKKDIMSYLLLGVSTSNLKSDGSLGREAELFILNQAARDLAYEFDLDRVFIKDDGTGEGYAIEVGKKISKKNMFVIESSKEGNSFILEHDISKNIKLRVGEHQKEYPSQSIDIYFRKRFK